MGATTRAMQWRNLALLIALVLAGVGGCSETNAVPENAVVEVDAPQTQPRRPSAGRADRDSLRMKAVAACECDLAKGEDCWSDYRAASHRFRPHDTDEIGGAATACAPVSTELDGLIDADGEFYVVTAYNVNGAELSNPRLCRQAEAKAVGDAISTLHDKAGDRGELDRGKVKRVAEEALAAVRAGRAPKAAPSSRGCV